MFVLDKIEVIHSIKNVFFWGLLLDICINWNWVPICGLKFNLHFKLWMLSKNYFTFESIKKPSYTWSGCWLLIKLNDNIINRSITIYDLSRNGKSIVRFSTLNIKLINFRKWTQWIDLIKFNWFWQITLFILIYRKFLFFCFMLIQ